MLCAACPPRPAPEGWEQTPEMMGLTLLHTPTKQIMILTGSLCQHSTTWEQYPPSVDNIFENSSVNRGSYRTRPEQAVLSTEAFSSPFDQANKVFWEGHICKVYLIYR